MSVCTIAAEWADFETIFTDHRFNRMDRKVLRATFYAGAIALSNLLREMSEYPAEERQAIFERLNEELTAFAMSEAERYKGG
jgi:hypothetical protein